VLKANEQDKSARDKSFGERYKTLYKGSALI
jgi:hypothetical protein